MGLQWRLTVVLQVRIATVKVFLALNFPSAARNWPKFAFWGEMWLKCEILFLGPQKAHLCMKRRHLMYWSRKSVHWGSLNGVARTQETRCSAIAERLRCRVRCSLGWKWKTEDWNWETIFYGHYRSIFNHCDIVGLKICQILWKKCKVRAITLLALLPE